MSGVVDSCGVLGADGAVVSAQAVDASTVDLSVGGQTVRVHFNADTIGGSLTRGGQTTALAAGVDALPE